MPLGTQGLNQLGLDLLNRDQPLRFDPSRESGRAVDGRGFTRHPLDDGCGRGTRRDQRERTGRGRVLLPPAQSARRFEQKPCEKLPRRVQSSRPSLLTTESGPLRV